MRASHEGLEILGEIFGSGLLDPETARVVPVHEEWMVAGKMVDLLWGPAAVNTNLFYASGLHRELADILYFQAPKEAGKRYWAR
jgi:hypothetical protein